MCLDVGERPLLENLRKGLIDPDTPKEARTKKNVNGKEMKLVVSCLVCHQQRQIADVLLQFSDEFNMPGRTFFEDDDPFFQAVDIWYGVTQDKEVSPDYCVQKSPFKC